MVILHKFENVWLCLSNDIIKLTCKVELVFFVDVSLVSFEIKSNMIDVDRKFLRFKQNIARLFLSATFFFNHEID